MVNNFFKKIFGSRNERLIKKMSKTVIQINKLEADVEALSPMRN